MCNRKRYVLFIDNHLLADSLFGIEQAYEAWRKAITLAECVEVSVDLVDYDTGETIESTNWDDD